MSISRAPAAHEGRGQAGASASAIDAPPRGASSPPPDAAVESNAGDMRSGPSASSPAPAALSPSSSSSGDATANEPTCVDDTPQASETLGPQSVLVASPKGSGNAGLLPFKVLLTHEQALEIYEHRPIDSAGANKSTEVANQYGVSPKTIRDVWNRKTWVKVTRPLWSAQEVASFLQDSSRRSKQVLNTSHPPGSEGTEGDLDIAGAGPAPIRPRSSRESRAPTRMHATSSPPPPARRGCGGQAGKKRKLSDPAVEAVGGDAALAVPKAESGTPKRVRKAKPPMSAKGGARGRGLAAQAGAGGAVGWDVVTSLSDVTGQMPPLAVGEFAGGAGGQGGSWGGGVESSIFRRGADLMLVPNGAGGVYDLSSGSFEAGGFDDGMGVVDCVLGDTIEEGAYGVGQVGAELGVGGVDWDAGFLGV